MGSALAQRLEQVETRLRALELDGAERQLKVLNAVEKIVHQLRSREAKRDQTPTADTREVQGVRGEGDGDDPRSWPLPPVPAPDPAPRVLSQLSRNRFRRF
jgi:hypothetical protein